MPNKNRKAPSSSKIFTYTAYCPIWVRQVIASYCELKTSERCLIKNERLQAVEKSYIYGLMTDLGLCSCLEIYCHCHAFQLAFKWRV